MGWETNIVGGGKMLIWIFFGCRNDRENMKRGRGERKEKPKKMNTKEEHENMRLGRCRLSFFFFF